MVLLELGIDSLVAVDIRAWFVTELRVDMPILKILGGSTIIDLVNDAVIRLPEILLPALDRKVEEASLVPNGLGGFVMPVVTEEPSVPTTIEETGHGEVASNSDLGPDTVLLRLEEHGKKDYMASTSLGFPLPDEDIFSEGNSPSSSDVSDLSDQQIDRQLEEPKIDNSKF